MAVEVELKAWVDDKARVENWLNENCTFIRSYEKDDIYFAPEDDVIKRLSFRLRREGKDSIVTIKEKAIVAGLEENIETEFSVSDGDAFVGFVTALGFKSYVRKRKRGKEYLSGGLRIELSDVECLGTFIEVEKLLDSSSQ
ncbi:MAG: class IV adenylate cyclase, partial [Spirochaetota bacterium]